MSLMSDRTITSEHGKYYGRIIVTPYKMRGRRLKNGRVVDSWATLGIICRYCWDDEDGNENVEIVLTEKEIVSIYKNLKKEVYINIHPVNTGHVGFQYAARIIDICMEKGVNWSLYREFYKRILKIIPSN
jgi:hypothetical protein